MRKIVLSLVAATVAIPAMSAPAAAQGYYQPNGAQRYDRNGDGYVTQREVRRTQRQDRRAQQQYQNSYGGYGNSYGNSYGSGGYYPQSYGNGYTQSYGRGYPQNYGGQYSRYYNQQGYYSGPTWRGNDGRYHCRRSDGTTGTIVGGAAGALIGSQVAGRGDSTVGAILGGAVGALIGRSVDRGGNRCN